MSAPAKFWDKIADKYSRKPMANPSAYANKVEAIKARLRGDETLLDIGCGTGTLVLDLAAHVGHAHGLDLSGEMVRIARRKAADAQADNVTFHHLTDGDLDHFEPASFEAICAFNILHLVADRRVTLTKIFELLVPGGTLVASTPCLGESWVPYRLMIPPMRWVGQAPEIVEIIGIPELEATIVEAGFVDLQKPDVGAASHTSFVLARKPG